MRGVITTTRGKTMKWPEQQSKIGKRNASAADLEQARAAIGSQVQLTRAYGSQPPPYTIADVRLDGLNRLIVDLVLIK